MVLPLKRDPEGLPLYPLNPNNLKPQTPWTLNPQSLNPKPFTLKSLNPNPKP